MNNNGHQSQRAWRNKCILAVAGLLGSALYSYGQQVDQSAPVGRGVYEAVINKGDGHVYVTTAGSRTEPGGVLYKIDPSDLTTVDSILLKENPPYGIGINNKTQVVCTTNTRTNSVSAVDLKTGKLIATITNGANKSHTREVLVDEENHIVYITDVGDPSKIWVIDGKTHTFSHHIDNLGKTATGMTFLNDTERIYLTVIGENAIYVVNTKTKEVENKFPSGGEAPVNITSDGERLFVTNQKSGTVTVLNKEGELIKSIETGAGAIGIAYDPVENRIYSANRGTGTTTIIDASNYQVLGDLETGSHPNHVKVDNNGVAFVINKTKGGRPVEGQPVAVDRNGDTITKIN